jgi:hypothetical protein
LAFPPKLGSRFDLSGNFSKVKMKNNSMAMIATVALVGILALLIGFFDPETCTQNQLEGWTSCSAIASQRVWALWLLVGLVVVGFAVSLTRKKKR